MNLNEYVDATDQTAIYEGAGTGSVYALMYTSLGLAAEAGEVANKVKKLYRDGYSLTKSNELSKELGDVIWYWARLCKECGFQPEYILAENLKKLLSRKDREVLGGNGDNR